MSYWLSVVMPVHMGAGYLGATLESAAAQAEARRGQGIEFRLYNSGDDHDAARGVAEAFADRLDIVWQDTPDIKPWTAKSNLGVQEARAPHVTMLHQDDLWLPGHAAALRAGLSHAADATLSIAPSRFIGPLGQDLGAWQLPFAPGLHDGRKVAQRLLVQNSIAILAPVIARDAWLACGGIDEALWYTGDWDLWLKLTRGGAVYVRPKATTGFRVHGESLTMTGSRDAKAFQEQHDIVLARHMPALTPLPAGLERRARVGAAINCALAEAANGDAGALGRATAALLALGPIGALRFLRESRLVDRVAPRLRLKFAGRF